MAFKDQLIANLDSEKNAEIKQFLEACGIVYIPESNQVIITGPEAPPVNFKDQYSVIMEAISRTDDVTTEPALMVSAGGNAELMKWEDYEQLAATPEQNIADIMELNGVSPGSFIPPSESAQTVSNEDATQLNMLTEEPASNQAGLPIKDGGVMSAAFPVQEDNTKKPNHKDGEDQPHPAQYGRESGVADMISGMARVFAKPITVPAKMATEQVKNLNHWRESRPQRMVDKANNEANKLDINLATFKADDDYSKIEATVTARGGWDTETLTEFEDFLDKKDMRNGWNMIRKQMQSLQDFSKKAVELAGPELESVSKSLDERIATIGKTAGKIPYKIKNGEVIATMQDAAIAMREMIAKLIEKITSIIIKRPASSPSA